MVRGRIWKDASFSLLSFATDALTQRPWAEGMKKKPNGERQMEGCVTDRDMKAKDEWGEEWTGGIFNAAFDFYIFTLWLETLATEMTWNMECERLQLN